MKRHFNSLTICLCCTTTTHLLIFGFDFAELVTELIKVVIGEAKHLDDGTEQQDVRIRVQLQFLTVVFHWNDTGEWHTKPSADLLHLDHKTQQKCSLCIHTYHRLHGAWTVLQNIVLKCGVGQNKPATCWPNPYCYIWMVNKWQYSLYAAVMVILFEQNRLI